MFPGTNQQRTMKMDDQYRHKSPNQYQTLSKVPKLTLSTPILRQTNLQVASHSGFEMGRGIEMKTPTKQQVNHEGAPSRYQYSHSKEMSFGIEAKESGPSPRPSMGKNQSVLTFAGASIKG